MFEDVKKEPEDILLGVERGAPPPTLPVEPPKVGAPVTPKPLGEGGPPQIEKPLAGERPQITAPEVSEPKVFWKKFLIVIGVLVVIAGGVMAAYVVIKKPLEKPATTPAPEVTAPEAPAVAPEEVPEIPEIPAAPPAEEVIPSVPVDTDGDGLTDDEEAVLGTNINSTDSDNDGLNDREEVKVYLTDPLNPDTDGDSYLDGHEVKNGYDPKGPGKLFTVPAPAE